MNKNYNDQDGDRTIIGGKLVVDATGEIVINDDAKLTINKVAVTATDAVNKAHIDALPIPQATSVQLLDNLMDNVNGFDYTSHKNEFGYRDDTHFSACFPIRNPSYSTDARFDEAWTISPLNTVVYHGCAPFDCFGSQGVPARPDSNTGYAMGVWAINGNLDSEALRLEHRIDIATIRQWYQLGKKTWTFSIYFAALPNDAAIMGQNLTHPSGQDLTGFINWEPTTPPDPKNNLKLQIVDVLGNVIIPKTTLDNYTVDSNWHHLTYSFTLDSTHEKYMRKQGADCWQLQLIFGNEGHPRHLIYQPTLKLA